MYIILKEDKAEKLKKHTKEIKEIACMLLECFDELRYERDDDDYSRNRSREDNRRDDYEDDDYMEDDRRMSRRNSPRRRGRY